MYGIRFVVSRNKYGKFFHNNILNKKRRTNYKVISAERGVLTITTKILYINYLILYFSLKTLLETKQPKGGLDFLF